MQDFTGLFQTIFEENVLNLTMLTMQAMSQYIGVYWSIVHYDRLNLTT